MPITLEVLDHFIVFFIIAVVPNKSQHGNIWHNIINLQSWYWVWRVKLCPKVHYFVAQQETPSSTVFMDSI